MIEIQEVSYRYQGEDRNPGLNDFTLKVHEGECVLLCGKSGCGKTTATRLLNGMIPHFFEGSITGNIFLDGESIFQLPMHEIAKKVGTLFQNPRTQFYTVNTTSEIAFGCENLGISPEKIKKRIEKAADDLEIRSLLDRNIFGLSGGEKQIIALAGIYAMDPQYYVLDEPSSNLDRTTVEKLRKILVMLKKKGKTILIAEHRTYYLKDLVDRVIHLEKGTITQEYTMSQLEAFSVKEQLRTGIRTVDLLKYPIKTKERVPIESSLSLKNLRFSYNKNKKETLRIDEFNISSGRITAIIGKNGAGKSTFVSCLCGLKKKTKGDFFYQGEKVSSKKRLRQSYIVMQEVNHQLFSDSVKGEIILGTGDYPTEKLTSITDRLDINSLLDRHPMTLSGGQKQRVIIASALFSQKKILCFDEPTSGLDFTHMIKTCELLKELKAKDRFLFVITHDYELIASLCDSVIHVEEGRIKQFYDLNEEGKKQLLDFFLTP